MHTMQAYTYMPALAPSNQIQVIVERRSFSIVAAVELDDASHLRPERRRRDILLEEVLRQAGIPLLRSHDARKLLQMTGEWLNTTGAVQQSPEHRS